MSIKYDSKRELLSEIIKKATINATYVIPDLQRPYVWSPRQVIMLIDSLFRGWPFGSLLLWEVKPDCFQVNEGIPHRPFWQIIDRTGNQQGTTTSPLGQPATYQMVLDGQQRVQSLILALGGDQWGFQLKDSEWAMDLHDRRMKSGEHWSKASLCIDLVKFKDELDEKKDIVRKIDVGKILEWVILDGVLDQSSGSRPANYVCPLPTSKDNPGRFIRLSRLWDLVQKDLSEREYKKLLEPLLNEHKVDLKIMDELAEFMKVVENVKINSFVHALQIESFELTAQWSKDDYSEAIVNIFTRLNTAGRTLTREEITLAWLKVGWNPIQTNGKTAGQCLEDLKSIIGDRGLHLETDEVVRLISFIWSVEHRNGDLLDSKDLLKGSIIRTMATDVASTWDQLIKKSELCADLIKAKYLFENLGSFNAIIVYMAWYQLVFDCFEKTTFVNKIDEDSKDKELKELASQFLDRWVFGSQWANVWGEGAVLNFQNFATDLYNLHTKLKQCNANDLLSTVGSGIQTLMNRISVKAIDQINNTVVKDRRRVHAYYSFLWVWHRLDQDRWDKSSISMRTGRKRISKLEVDHTVADAWWSRLVDSEISTKQASFIGTDDEKANLAPSNFSSKNEALAHINLLGNCSLLDKTFNISKSANTMWAFLQKVHEFSNSIIKRQDFENALSLTPIMTEPDKSTFGNIEDAIRVRDNLIRKELVEFINGKKYRVDI